MKFAKNLSPNQVEELKLYFKTIREIIGNNSPGNELSEDELKGMTPIYKLIERLGNGDPIKAGIRHAEVLINREKQGDSPR